MRRSHPPCSYTKRRLTNGLGRRILRTISLVPYPAPLRVARRGALIE